MQTEAQKLKQKCKDLKRKIRDIEDSSEVISLAVARSKLAARRLRSEYTVLLEVLERKTTGPVDEALDDAQIGPEIDDFSGLNNLLASVPKGKPAATTGTPAAKKKRGGVGALKKAREKDPSIPKRPTNAYLIFCDLEKENIKKELESNNPGVVMDLSKGLTEAWKRLDEEGRKPYYELYEEDRRRYHRELDAYQKKKAAEDVAASEPPSTPLVDAIEPVDPLEAIDPVYDEAMSEPPTEKLSEQPSDSADAVEPEEPEQPLEPSVEETPVEQTPAEAPVQDGAAATVLNEATTAEVKDEPMTETPQSPTS